MPQRALRYGTYFTLLMVCCSLYVYFQYKIHQRNVLDYHQHNDTSSRRRHSILNRTKSTASHLKTDSIQITETYTSVGKQPLPKVNYNEVEETPFINISPTNVYIVSAIARNSSENLTWDTMTVNAWEAFKHHKQLFTCCYLMRNNKTVSEQVTRRSHWKKDVRLLSVQYQCKFFRNPHQVIGVSLTLQRENCDTDIAKYVSPVFPMRKANHSLGLCAKIVYGQPDPDLLIDWLEYYREMLVDQVVMFTYNITETTDKILQHYAKAGFVELKKFDFPWKNSHARTVGLKTPQVWQDEQVVVYDCQERLRGYSYVGFIDLDEFLLPPKNRNMKEMMATLLKIHPNAGGFTFMSHLFVKDWGPTVLNNGSDIRKYLRRTKPVYTRWKNIYLPSRVESGNIHTHTFYPKPNYARVIPKTSLAVVNHYRQCYPNMKHICNRVTKYRDTRILKFVDRISARVSSTKALLGLE